MDTTPISRDTVFIAGGQPSITYVERESLHIERQLARAIATPNQIISLSGPTKSGKTVLCRHVLGQQQFIWIEGGQLKGAADAWNKICYELNYPIEISKSVGTKKTFAGTVQYLIFSGTGSQLWEKETSRTYRIDSMSSALRHLKENGITSVIDDFHYLENDEQTEFLRNVKGSVFSGLRVILLSVAHRTFDAIKAESELTGRFISVKVPEWSKEDLCAIPHKGFKALRVSCSEKIIDALAEECQSSPFLMQKLCWDICFDIKVDAPADEIVKVPTEIALSEIYVQIAKDAGLPIYERLVAGPQIRKDRIKRPLVSGGDADVYEATLLAIADTGPQSSITYNVLRNSLNNILSDKIPQKHEVTSVLKQLSRISRDIGADVGVDWDDEKRTLDISDPYLRFFLRWQIRKRL